MNEVVLVPAVPDEKTPGDAWVRFIIDDKGIPKLSTAARERLVQQHIRRWADDGAYRESFVTALRRATSAERSAFRGHMFDALKPMVLRDVKQFHTLAGDQRAAYVDERIVAYNRMSSLLGSARVDKAALGDALPKPAELTELLFAKTTEQERDLGSAYFSAIGARVNEILADEPLKKNFEARIAAGPG